MEFEDVVSLRRQDKAITPLPRDLVVDVPLLGVSEGPMLFEVQQLLERSGMAEPVRDALPSDVPLASEPLVDGVKLALTLDSDETAVLRDDTVKELRTLHLEELGC